VGNHPHPGALPSKTETEQGIIFGQILPNTYKCCLGANFLFRATTGGPNRELSLQNAYVSLDLLDFVVDRRGVLIGENRFGLSHTQAIHKLIEPWWKLAIALEHQFALFSKVGGPIYREDLKRLTTELVVRLFRSELRQRVAAATACR
jgi:hypothetical protein